MPSTQQSGDSALKREVFPEIADEIGEDPARFLDKPLAPDYSSGGDTTALALAKVRIDGIDKLEVVARWLEVEHQLERGPRDSIVERLEQRGRELKEHGERDLPNLSPEERRVRAAELFEESIAVWPERDGGERSSVFTSSGTAPRTATDGGESE